MPDISKVVPLLGDIFAVGGDLPESFYDRLYRYLEAKGVIPEAKRERMLLVAAALVAARFVKLPLGPLGPIASLTDDVITDLLRGLAKRAIEHRNQSQAVTVLSGGRTKRAPVSTVLIGNISELNEFLFPWMKGRSK